MNSITPEHDKRDHYRQETGSNHPDISASYRYVDSVVDTADYKEPFLAWHGWALREAFLAGCSYAAQQNRTEVKV